MHPCWAVRRLTQEQFKSVAAKDKQLAVQALNCEVTHKQFSVVPVGCVKGKSVPMTILVNFPFITNKMAVKKGDELLLEIYTTKAKPNVAAHTWKTQTVQEEKKKGVMQMKGAELQGQKPIKKGVIES